MFKKIAIVMTMGALTLTGCSVAPTTQGADAPALTGEASRSAAATASAKATTAASAPSSASAAAPAPSSDPMQSAAAAPAPATQPGAVEPAPAGTPKSVATAATTTVVPAAAATGGDGTQAATTLGWGSVVAGDEFSYTGAPDSTKWGVYNGPGHSGQGVRSPSAWSVANGLATVSGDAAGTTGGMSAKFAQQKYGRWESRMKTSARDPQYHPVMILWPANNASPNCAEVDYAEGSSDTTMMKFFLHYACGGSGSQTTAAQPIDSTQWHNYAVEWTAAGITGYIDGVKTFTDTNPAHIPTVAMHQTLQLDWFPDGSATKPSQMMVDWVRVYK